MKSIMEEASTIAKAIESAWNRAGKPHDFQIKVLEYPETSFFGLKTAKSAKIAFFFSEESVRQAPKPAAARPTRQPAVARPVANKAPERAERPERQPREGQDRRSQQRSEHPRRDRQDNRGEQRAERTERPERAERRPYEPRTQEQREQRSLERSEQQNSYESRTHESREPRVERTEQQSSYEHRTQEQREPREHRSPERSERSEHRSSYEPRNYEQREQRSHDRNDRDRHDNKDVWTPEMVAAAQDWLKETVALMGHPDAQITPQVSYNYLKLQLDKPISSDARQEELQLKSWGSLLIEALREKFNKPLRNLRIIIESRQN